MSWFVGTCRASAEPKDFDPSPTNQIPCGLVARQLTCLERPSKAIQVYSLGGWLWAGLNHQLGLPNGTVCMYVAGQDV